MTDRRLTDAALAAGIADAGRALAYPATPPLAAAVEARLNAERAAGTRPSFPGVAIWSRRRVLVLAAVGLLALLGLGFGVRLVIGAAEVRVVPGVTPSGPPLGPPNPLGDPTTLEAAEAAVAFDLRLPLGRAPDDVYVFTNGPQGGAGALLAWNADRRAPALPETPWGLVLLQMPDDAESVLKDIDRFEDLREVEVGGERGFWIDAPHQLTVISEDGARSFAVRGNVLIWSEHGVTFRLETSLDARAAIALAETIDRAGTPPGDAV
jgi:hypothetical protein